MQIHVITRQVYKMKMTNTVMLIYEGNTSITACVCAYMHLCVCGYVLVISLRKEMPRTHTHIYIHTYIYIYCQYIWIKNSYLKLSVIEFTMQSLKHM